QAIRTALSSTLFPYTTLFRSRTRQVLGRGIEITLIPINSLNTHSTVENLTGHGVEEKVTVVSDSRVRQGGDNAVKQIHHTTLGGDRKSTRLNSSHVSISYAVF